MRDTVLMFEKLSEPMPSEALIHDPSRGSLVLVGFKNAYVVERLNKTLGLCGYGWRFANGPFRVSEDGKRIETVVALQYRVYEDNEDAGGFPPCYYNQSGELEYEGCEEGTLPVWSSPIISYGEQLIINKRIVDAKKGAVSSGIAKCASVIGVGADAYKGRFSYEDGAIVEKESGTSPEAQALSLLVGRMGKNDPEGLELVRKASPIVKEIVAKEWLLQLGEFIKTAELGDFVKDNFELIVGRKCDFSDLTMPEILSTGHVINSIYSGDIGIEDVIELLKAWDRSVPWKEHVEGKEEPEDVVEDVVVEVEDG